MALPERFLILFQVFYAVSVLVNVPFLQKTVKSKARESQELACLIMRERPGTIPFHDQGFERLTTRILVLGKVVGQLDGYFHACIIRLFQATPNVGDNQGERDEQEPGVRTLFSPFVKTPEDEPSPAHGAENVREDETVKPLQNGPGDVAVGKLETDKKAVFADSLAIDHLAP